MALKGYGDCEILLYMRFVDCAMLPNKSYENQHHNPNL